jgi:hypothetical protein
MRAESRFKAVATKRVQQDAHGVDGRRSLQVDAEHLVEHIQSLLHKNDDIAETFGSRQNRQNRKQEQIGQRVTLSLITSGIRDLLQSIKEPGERKHGILTNNDILCPRKNPKIQESCKNKVIRRTGAKGQLKNARRDKNRLRFNLPSPSLCFSGFQTV